MQSPMAGLHAMIRELGEQSIGQDVFAYFDFLVGKIIASFAQCHEIVQFTSKESPDV